MKQYRVTGMSCAACSARVEKAVSAVEGVTGCAVSLLTNSMGVEGDVPPEEIIAAVERAGYGAALKSAEKTAQPAAGQPDDTETPKLLRRLIASAFFLLMLLYVSMGHMMWRFPLPVRLAENPAAIGLVQLLLAGIVMVINQRFFISGFRAILHRAPNMDTLVALGAAASFLWSTAELFIMTDAAARGNAQQAADCLKQLYFESAAMILTLITVGKTLEARAKGKTTNALKSLMKLAPKTAVILENGVEREIPAEQILPGMQFLVKPGAQIPADGKVLEGSGAVDESALTGESIPADKTEGDSVSAGTINQAGFLRCEALRTGADTMLSQIVKTVEDAAATKAPIAKTADRVSGIFVPAVIAVSAVTFAVWMLLGQSAGYALARAVSVLVISCPCALGLATPVAIMVGSGVGARNGILYKTAAALEETGRIRFAAIDKTGTVTEGQPKVTDLLPAAGVTETALLEDAAAAEQHSEHPLARAVMAYAAERGVQAAPVTDFAALAGSGVTAKCGGAVLRGGNLRSTAESAEIPPELAAKAEQLAGEGKTPLFFLRNGKLRGMIAVADVIRQDSAEAVAKLHNMGITTVMITGDQQKTADTIGKTAGIDRVIAGVLPDGKAEAIRTLAQDGKVCMIGDGINDAPALTVADIGMAIGAGTDIAMDAADVVLMRSSLTDAVNAIALSRRTLRNIHQNLFWAFLYNIIGIPLAAGVLVPFGLTLNPMFGAAAMSLSSFCVVTNALRLNFFRAEKPGGSLRQIQTQIQKGTVNQMNTITLEIKGMMCPHCEAHVKKALEAMDGVTVQGVSHETGTAQVQCAAAADEAAFRRAITEAGYELTGVKAG